MKDYLQALAATDDLLRQSAESFGIIVRAVVSKIRRLFKGR